ncbi:MAG: DUF2064 domain-containing protein [Nonlabens sp.]
MNSSRQHTAVLVFAQSGKQDAFLKSCKESAGLFDALTQHTVKLVQDTGLPYFISTERDQRGDSFGERLYNSIEQVFIKGFKNVIAIGNDTPHLGIEHLKKSVQLVDSGNMVIGPSMDGGFYLLGISNYAFAKAEHLNPQRTFQELDWNTSSLLVDLQQWLNTEPVVLLTKLRDLDHHGEARQILRSRKQLDVVVFQILQLFNEQLSQDIQHLSTINAAFFIDVLHNKGSPC